MTSCRLQHAAMQPKLFEVMDGAFASESGGLSSRRSVAPCLSYCVSRLDCGSSTDVALRRMAATIHESKDLYLAARLLLRSGYA